MGATEKKIIMKTKKILLYVAYSIGMFMAALSVIVMLLMLFDPEQGQGTLKKFLVYGAALGFGFVILLLAAMFRPFERRFVLIVTLVTFLVTIFTSIIVHKHDPFQMWYYWFSMIIPGIVALFYLFVYFFSCPADTEKEKNIEPGETETSEQETPV